MQRRLTSFLRVSVLFRGKNIFRKTEILGYKGNIRKSKLFSTSDIQSIMKKAMVKRMEKAYGKSWFEEDGALSR